MFSIFSEVNVRTPSEVKFKYKSKNTFIHESPWLQDILMTVESQSNIPSRV